MQGNWSGHCQQYGTLNASGTGYCIPYKQAPARYNYHVMYANNVMQWNITANGQVLESGG